jgi:hypothetical protein
MSEWKVAHNPMWQHATRVGDNLSDAAKANPDHPLQYAIKGHPNTVTTMHTENDIRRDLGERFNRCPTCEQWSPCDVRRIFPSGDTTGGDE